MRVSTSCTEAQGSSQKTFRLETLTDEVNNAYGHSRAPREWPGAPSRRAKQPITITMEELEVNDEQEPSRDSAFASGATRKCGLKINLGT